MNTLGRKHVRFCAEHVLRLGFLTGINDIGDGPFEKRPSHASATDSTSISIFVLYCEDATFYMQLPERPTVSPAG